jgi:hypothetical protein
MATRLFGNSAFMATKLIAAGVRFVNVIWTWYYGAYPGVADYGWDTHEHNFSILRSYLPQVDRVYSATAGGSGAERSAG